MIDCWNDIEADHYSPARGAGHSGEKFYVFERAFIL
jgi:hypothetical protein